MARECMVCVHPKVNEINQMLVSGQRLSYRDMARQYSVTKDSLYRHNAEHLPARLVKAKNVREALETDDLLAQARTIQQQAFRLLGEATQPERVPCKRCGEPHYTIASPTLALRAMQQASNGVRLLGEVLGKLQPQPAGGAQPLIQNNVVVVTRYEIPTNGREAPTAAPPIPRGALPPSLSEFRPTNGSKS